MKVKERESDISLYLSPPCSLTTPLILSPKVQPHSFLVYLEIVPRYRHTLTRLCVRRWKARGKPGKLLQMLLSRHTKTQPLFVHLQDSLIFNQHHHLALLIMLNPSLLSRLCGWKSTEREQVVEVKPMKNARYVTFSFWYACSSRCSFVEYLCVSLFVVFVTSIVSKCLLICLLLFTCLLSLPSTPLILPPKTRGASRPSVRMCSLSVQANSGCSESLHLVSPLLRPVLLA